MILNKSLAIVVPTYNRKKVLEVWLEHHAQFLFSKKIRIHIQDNHSTDGTKTLLIKWKKKFKNISFKTNNKNLHSKSLNKAFKMIDAKFIWVIGDTYAINIEAIDKALLTIEKKNPLFIFFNLKKKISNLGEGYVDAKFVCENLLGLLSCISCIIYNKRRLKKIIFKDVLRSRFSHTLYVLNQMKLKKRKGYWIPLSVNSLNLKIPYKNWATKKSVFKIGCKNWIDSIDSLHDFSYSSKKLAYRLFNEATNLFNWKGGLWLRAQGLLTINKIRTYKIYLNKSVGKSYLLLYLIALIPIYPLKILKKIYDQCLKK